MDRRDFVSAAMAGGAWLAAGARHGMRRRAAGADRRAPRSTTSCAGITCAAVPGRASWTRYLKSAALPAWQRAGVGPVGVFSVMIGAGNPTFYVLIVHKSLDAFASLPERLAADAEYQSAAAPYLNVEATAPAFVRIETSLMRAFEGIPKLELPFAGGEGARRPRIFELRTYESHSEKAARKKIEMFNARRDRDLPPRRDDAGVLRGDARRRRHAEPHLHARLRGHGGARQAVERVRGRSGMEEAVDHARLHRSRDRVQHQQHVPAADGLLADLTCGEQSCWSKTTRRSARSCGRRWSSAGHEVEEASNGDVALAAYRRQAADVVITDLVMPDKDGLETIMLLRRLDPAVKIIAMSGGGRTLGSGQLYLETARSIGALQILAKPFTGSALLHAVTEVLALPGA